MAPDPVGALMYVVRFMLNPLLFAVAGVVLAISRPRWAGTWFLLFGALLSLVVVAMRFSGVLSNAASDEVWFAYEAAESLGFLLTGLGVLLVAWRARNDAAV
jgi:hypothetical protein